MRDALNDWNVNAGRRQGVVVLPWMYERHAVPVMGDRAQALINSQAVDRSDVVVAFFDSRLGSDTGVDVSGTAEEINRAIDQGKPVHVYFSDEPLPRDVDPDQLTALRTFQASLEGRGLLGRYSHPGELAAQAVRALEQDIADGGWGESLATAPTRGADLEWEHIHTKDQTGFDTKGKIKTRTTRNHLVVRNTSATTAAEDLAFTVESLAGDFAGRFDGPSEPLTLHPRSEREWPLLCLRRMTLEIHATWSEGGIPREQVSTVTAH